MANSENDIIKACIKNKRWAQEALYNEYAPKLMPICMRYARHTHEAEDIMHMGFLKAFRYLHTYNGSGSLYSWLKRVFVNAAIKNYTRQKKHFQTSDYDTEAYHLADDTVSAVEKLKEEDLMRLINELPEGYRIIFNLYVIEGYKHKEIAQMLDISVGTSKSQLAKAKNLLREKIVERRTYSEEILRRHAG